MNKDEQGLDTIFTNPFLRITGGLNDLAVASDHGHRFPPTQIHQIHVAPFEPRILAPLRAAIPCQPRTMNPTQKIGSFAQSCRGSECIDSRGGVTQHFPVPPPRGSSSPRHPGASPYSSERILKWYRSMGGLASLTAEAWFHRASLKHKIDSGGHSQYCCPLRVEHRQLQNSQFHCSFGGQNSVSLNKTKRDSENCLVTPLLL